ncbi:putative phosphoribosyl transferase [Oceanisphaera litoralis]|uniref:phosphoribosyltransferase n=1 Tax=Oceanisphaera litoralis TaxID=225144 RepID=UPI00195A7841|nr:phosphoribosyltransferase [Oceanisphaera litoralis]MBM7454268.1 putative phosphoribosyl transferase [Oceanisphaera litoralis]
MKLSSFPNRRAAGQALARLVLHYRDVPDLQVLGLPRGGVPVAFEVAKALGAPLDVLLVRKLGYPGHPELAMGAIASGDIMILNPGITRYADIGQSDIDAVIRREQAELQRREQLYRGQSAPLALAGAHVLLVDDGLATGATMEAAIRAVRKQAPAHIGVAVPVGSTEAAARINALADEFIALIMSDDFGSVGQFYDDFGQTSDSEVCELLARAARR